MCACALGAGAGASGASAAENDDKVADGPVTDVLIPVVDKRLEPPSSRPTKAQVERYLELHRKARKKGADPGLNIVHRGFKERDGDFRLAVARDIKRSTKILERMTAPKTKPKLRPATEQSGGAKSTTGAGRDSAGGGGAGGQLGAIAACESGGDPGAVGGGGQYRGKYQFSRETWASVGGSGDPAAASEAEQDQRAGALLARDGAGHWANCAK